MVTVGFFSGTPFSLRSNFAPSPRIGALKCRANLSPHPPPVLPAHYIPFSLSGTPPSGITMTSPVRLGFIVPFFHKFPFLPRPASEFFPYPSTPRRVPFFPPPLPLISSPVPISVMFSNSRRLFAARSTAAGSPSHESSSIPSRACSVPGISLPRRLPRRCFYLCFPLGFPSFHQLEETTDLFFLAFFPSPLVWTPALYSLVSSPSDMTSFPLVLSPRTIPFLFALESLAYDWKRPPFSCRVSILEPSLFADSFCDYDPFLCVFFLEYALVPIFMPFR